MCRLLSLMLLYDAKFLKIRQEVFMLIPDNIHPEQTIYFNGSFVLKTIQKYKMIDMLDLYMQTISEQNMTMPVFVLVVY